MKVDEKSREERGERSQREKTAGRKNKGIE